MARKPRLKPAAGSRRAPIRKRAAKRSSSRRTGGAGGTGAVRLIAFSVRWHVVVISRLRRLLGTSRCTGLAIEAQQQTQWCWAAVSNSVSQFYNAGSTWTQCTIVNAELGQSTCCTNGSTAACNQPWYLDKALTRVGCLQSMASGTLTFATVKSLLNGGRPPCARQGWSGGGGHFMAIVCYYEGILGLLAGAGSTARRLKISDPWYGDAIIDYTTFVSGYQGSGSWTHSYRTEP